MAALWLPRATRMAQAYLLTVGRVHALGGGFYFEVCSSQMSARVCSEESLESIVVVTIGRRLEADNQFSYNGLLKSLLIITTSVSISLDFL